MLPFVIAALAPALLATLQASGRGTVIVAMGDSTTAGTPNYKSPRESPPAGIGDIQSQYAWWLMKDHPKWTVINQGINGQRSDEIHARFASDVLAKRPAIVVLIAGVNDVYQGRDAASVERELDAIYAAAKKAGIKVVAGSILPFNTASDDQNARMHEINDWIRQQAEANPTNMAFVDTRAAVAASDDGDRLAASPDGLHPDVDGYHRMADVIGPAIELMLRSR